MYDSYEILSNIDQNMWKILILCGFAMLCNYIWFFEAVRLGFKERVSPMPVFCILLWLVGDSSMVLRFDLWFNVIDHWYVKLFWLALVLTVMSELVLLYLMLRFGREEIAPRLSQTQFTAMIFVGLVATAIIFEQVKRLIGDELYIDYFHLANMSGPVFAAAMLARRGSRLGSSVRIWVFYTLMVVSWFTACTLWYGGPFAESQYILFYISCTVFTIAIGVWVARLSAEPIAEPARQD